VDAAVEQLANGDDGHGRSPVLDAESASLAVVFRLTDRPAGLVPGTLPLQGESAM
jgi:hypothetical protein